MHIKDICGREIHISCIKRSFRVTEVYREIMMMKGTIFAVGCVFIIGTAAAADGVPGKCPDIELVKDFVPSKVRNFF